MQGTDPDMILPPKCVMFSANEGAAFREYMLTQGINSFIYKLPSKEQIFNLIVDTITEVKNDLASQKAKKVDQTMRPTSREKPENK